MYSVVIVLRERCLKNLIKRANSIGPRKHKMFAEGRWTGILNALDKNSPHAVTTIDECLNWYAEGILLLRKCIDSKINVY